MDQDMVEWLMGELELVKKTLLDTSVSKNDRIARSVRRIDSALDISPQKG